jgi:hypothetical protein
MMSHDAFFRRMKVKELVVSLEDPDGLVLAVSKR